MKNILPPPSVEPQNDREIKKLEAMEGEDVPPYIPSHESVIRWFDLLPIHYIFLQIFIIWFLSLLLNRNLINIYMIFIIISMPLLIYSIYRTNALEKIIFKKRFVLPTKRSYTTIIFDESHIPKYRFWLRLTLSLSEICFLFIFVAKYY